jgi:hypothetical protein
MKWQTKWLALILGFFAFQLPLKGEEHSFAALWTGEATYSEGELLALARQPEPTARQFAALRLAELDPCPDAALDALLQALGDPVDSVRFQALAGLVRLGRRATPGLAATLSDLKEIPGQETSRSDLAFAALIEAVERGEVNVGALFRAYQSAPPEASDGSNKPSIASPRKRLRTVLEEIAEANRSDVDDFLHVGDPFLLLLAARRLIQDDEKSRAAPILAKVIRETDDTSVRQEAAGRLAFLAPDGPKSLQSLLQHQNPKVRISALLAYPEEAQDSSQRVAALLNDPEPEMRNAALNKIGRSGEFEDLCYGDEPPALWANLPESVLSKVLLFAKDAYAPTRKAAVGALGALGCTRPEIAPKASEALAAMLSDPAEQVASSVASPLRSLVLLEAAPTSPAALDRVLGRLTQSTGEEERRDLLTVLQYMPLPEERRKELIDELLTLCLLGTEEWDCSREQEILNAHPGWPEAAAAALASRFPDVRKIDARAWKALESLGLKSHLGAEALEKLLEHPDKNLRISAAVALAQKGYVLPREVQVLEEGVLSYDEEDRWKAGEASQAMANLGEWGIGRLLTIMKDPETEEPARRVLMAGTLSGLAEKSSKTAKALLEAASDPANPAIQLAAVEAVHSLRPQTKETRAALERAFSLGDAEVRRAVVSGWREEMPEGFVERVLADPAPKVRATLLWILPEEDPRRLPLTAAALKGTDEEERHEALRLAGKLGDPGAALLAEYVQRGEPLTESFFFGVDQLDTLEGPLGSALAARMAGESPEVRNRLIALLTSNGIPLNREFLYTQLEAASEVDRYYAARALTELGEDPWAHDGLLAAVLMDSKVREIMEWRLGKIQRLLKPSISAPESGGPRPTSPRMPKFPWPPPPGYSRVLVPRELFATSTLGDVQKKLVGALVKASVGFDYGLFSGPADGFTLVARMERIERDGTPLPEPARWIKKGSPKLNLSELLGDLFFEKPGYFRIIVFAVTDDLAPGESASAHLPEPSRGAAGMPRDLAERPFDGKEVLALIYSFERRHDARITPWTDGAPSARQHLERAGIWPRLEQAASPRP